jgi:tetratricopeptide (TPR) repeat protein
VSSSQSTVEALLQLIPQVDELEVLRLEVVAAAVPDPQKAWDSSSAYSTVDKRILTPEDADHALDRARDAVLKYVTALHEGMRPVFRSYFEGDVDGAARQLVLLGEQHENNGRAMDARRCYHAALGLVLPLPDKAPQILALRRLGRVSLALGDFKEATAFYERSAELARDTGDLRSEVIARTGTGNVNSYQGRWSEAEVAYNAALKLAEQSDSGRLTLEEGQLYNNLGNAHTRVGRLDEAEECFARADALWNEVDSPLDRAVYQLNLGHLREAQGRTADARQAYETGVELAIPSSIKALIAADLADMCLREGNVTEAEDMGKVAEEHAIQSGSPYALGYMYRNLGNLARARGDEDGFTFYEKALQIAREKGYPSLEAETLADYAELRRHAGGSEEAEAYLERACEMFGELGWLPSLANAERALAELRAQRTALEDAPETPMAAAGD